MLLAVLALFAAYAAGVTWQMRRALNSAEPAARKREAVRLLLLVSAGVPLSAALILVVL